MSLVHVLHRDINADIAGLFVRDIANRFYAETIIDIHCDLMSNESVSEGKNQMLSNLSIRPKETYFIFG